jgi:serine/threonine-protein kinase
MPEGPPGDRWRHVKAVFGDAIELDPSERAAFLDRACAGDPETRAEVASLLEAHERAGGFIETPAVVTALAEGGAGAWEGRLVGPYRIERELGRGGMGTVYLAVRADDAYRKQVAVKVIKRGMDTDEIVARFRRERQTLANLDHPSIARLIDGGTTADGLPYFVLEYVEGRPLDTYCEQQRLGVTARLRLFRAVCDGVQFAHRNLVVHRDLKPDNILVTADGTPKLLDFGISKVLTAEPDYGAVAHTRDAQRLLTLDYASPEQLRGEPVSTATDVFALGVMLYELLSGTHPFRRPGRPPAATEVAICDEHPPRPSVAAQARGDRDAARRLAGDLDAIIMAAMHKAPAERYGSAAELNDDLRRHLEGLPVTAQGESFGYLAATFVRRHKAAAAATLAVALTLIAGIIGTAWQARVAQAERDRARTEAAKAERVSAVLRGMLRSADPAIDGRNVTVEQTLAAASQRIGVELRDQPEIRAAVRSAIGSTFFSLGLWDEATAELSDALTVLRALHGDRHPAVSQARIELAYVALEQGELDVAEREIRDALQALDGGDAASDDVRATALNGLGRIAAGRGRGEEAVAYYRDALDIRRRLHGERDAQVAEIINNLAVQAQARGDLPEAERLYRDALRIAALVHGEEDPGYAAGLSNLGGVLHSQQKLGEARATYERALALRLKILGPEHPDVAFTELNYADLLSQLGEQEPALALIDRILSKRGRVLPESHPMVAAALTVGGRARMKSGDLAGAERDLRESVALRRRLLPSGHWLIANTESILGECLAARAKSAEAGRLLEASYQALLASRGPDHERTREARDRLERFRAGALRAPDGRW